MLIILIFLYFGCASLKPSVTNEVNKIVPEQNKSPPIDKVKEVPPLTLKSIFEKTNNFSSSDAKLQYCNFINENTSLFENFTLIPTSMPEATNANREFKSAFIAQINIEDMSFIQDLEFIVAYPAYKNGKLSLSYEKLKADEKGYVSFTSPKSAFAIDGSLTIRLNFFKTDDLEEDFAFIDKNISEVVKSKTSVSFDYKVATANRRLSSAIAILDYEQNKRPILNENTTSKHLLMQMMKTGFSRTGLASFAELANGNETAIVENAKKTFNGAVELYLFGKTYIRNVEKLDDGSWKVEIQGNLNIWNLKQNKKLTSFDVIYSSVAKTQREAILKARRILGEEILYQKILYNL